jgi:hypothetical protein
MSDPNRTVSTEGNPVQPPSPYPDDRSPPDLDAAILRASRRAVRFHRLTVFLEKWHISFVARPEFLVGVIVGALACALIQVQLARPSESAAPGMARAGDTIPSSVNAETADASSPQSWLQRIAALVRDGNVAEAESQLRAFRQRYPDAERAVSR